MRAPNEELVILESDVTPAYEELPPNSRLVVAAVVKNAFGLAIGTVSALWLGGFAAAATLNPANESARKLAWLIGVNYLPGYAPTWSGVFVGLVWGFAGGFAVGFGVALARNRLLKLLFWMDAVRARLSANRTVLDDLS